MKTLAPAARVCSPGALVLGAARGEWGSGPPLGAAARRPELICAGTDRRERLRHLQPLARRGRRNRVAAGGQGSRRALRARSLAEADPAPGERPRPSARRSTRRSAYGRQANAAAADAGGEAVRPPARPPARARPPTPRSARRAGRSSTRAARSSARRPSLRQARARTSSGAPGGWGTTLPRRLLRRSPLRPLPFPAPSPADRAPPTPRVLPPGGGEGGRLEGRREGAREHADWEQPGGVTAIDETDGQGSPSAPRTGRRLLQAGGGEGHSGATGLGE